MNEGSLESRVHELEKQVGELRETVARVDERTKTIIRTLTQLTEELKPVSEAVQKGKGGLAVVMLLAGLIGAALTTFFQHLFGRGA